MAAATLVVGLSHTRFGANRRFGNRAVLAAARSIRGDAAGLTCHVIGDAYTQLEWYSGCRSSTWPWDALGRGERIYLVRKSSREPPDPVGLPGRPRTLLDLPGANVVRFAGD